MLTKITLELHDSWLAARMSLCKFDQAASFELRFCNIFKCTRILFFFFLLLFLPKALRYHLTVYTHVCMVGNTSSSGQQANMWFYTCSSMLCPQRVRKEDTFIVLYFGLIGRARRAAKEAKDAPAPLAPVSTLSMWGRSFWFWACNCFRWL